MHQLNTLLSWPLVFFKPPRRKAIFGVQNHTRLVSRRCCARWCTFHTPSIPPIFYGPSKKKTTLPASKIIFTHRRIIIARLIWKHISICSCLRFLSLSSCFVSRYSLEIRYSLYFWSYFSVLILLNLITLQKNKLHSVRERTEAWSLFKNSLVFG